MGFQIADYVVFGLSLIVSLGIGIFYSFKQKSTEEYFTGRRQLSLIPVAISMMATFTSAHSMLGTPAEIYAYGTQYTMHIFGAVLGNVMGALLFVPLFHPLDITSVFEYIEMRFRSRPLKLFANIIKLMAQLFMNGVGIYAPSVALQTVTGIPVWASMLICGITTTIYTSIGGMKAVIWTDVFQSFFIYSGMIAVVTIGWIKVGGFTRAFELNKEWDRLQFFNMSVDPTLRGSFWSNVFCQGILFFSLTSVQASVQRYCGLPSLKKAKQSLYLNAVGLFVSGLLFSLAGFVAFAYYAGIGCDPLKAKLIRSSNQILPYFVMDTVNYPGLPGLFVACLASTALSTSSSTLNGCAAMIWQDLLRPFFGNRSEKTKANISKLIVVFLGFIAVVAGFIVMNIKGTLIQIVFGIAGALIGPVTGIYVLGATNPRANAKAATIGFSVALAFNILLATGAALSQAHTRPLPSPVSGCHMNDGYMLDNSTISLNISLADDMGNYEILNRTNQAIANDMVDPDSHQGTLPTHTCPTMSDYMQANMKKLFSISYLYYPLFGIAINVIVASLFAIFTPFSADYYVEDKHLFPFVAYFRQKLQSHIRVETTMNHEKCEMTLVTDQGEETPPPIYNEEIMTELSEKGALLGASNTEITSKEKHPLDTV